MAEDKAEPRKKRRLKVAPTMREKAEKSQAKASKPSRLSKIKVIGVPLKAAKAAGLKEYHPIKLPNNKLGRFLRKRVRLMPRYFIDAWKELKLVKWPSHRQTMRLVIAVFLFASIFGSIIGVTDSLLDNLFRRLIIK
jgi:preprotein translocase SecE subunit